MDREIARMLGEAYQRFATPDFVAADPVQVPRAFTHRADAEVMGFLTATIAWGRRSTIIANAWKLARLMEERPLDFVMNADATDLKHVGRFVHRTFNGTDLRHFVRGLRHLHTHHGGLENAFLADDGTLGGMHTAIARFRQRFLTPRHPPRVEKHVADPTRGSHAKRINLFLRWMVRPADRGVDLGLWKRIAPRDLMVPLDVHTGRTARALGLLRRRPDDWKAVEELTAALRTLDADDPVKYDIALFGLGVEDRAARTHRPRIRASS